MSKKTAAPKKGVVAKKTTTAAKAVAVEAVATPVRYSALPKLTAPVAVAAPKLEITHERIAAKAYELFTAGRSGSEMDHWLAAEAELRTAA